MIASALHPIRMEDLVAHVASIERRHERMNEVLRVLEARLQDSMVVSDPLSVIDKRTPDNCAELLEDYLASGDFLLPTDELLPPVCPFAVPLQLFQGSQALTRRDSDEALSLAHEGSSPPLTLPSVHPSLLNLVQTDFVPNKAIRTSVDGRILAGAQTGLLRSYKDRRPPESAALADLKLPQNTAQVRTPPASGP